MTEDLNWTWELSDNPSVASGSLYELYDDAGVMLAWIHKRPGYCDRGHWQLNVETVPDLDSQDGFPRYFMSLKRAQDEGVDFLKWRLFRTPYKETNTCP